MHHYRRNISDWNDHTRHLSRVEKSVYQDLFELYLQTERPLPDDVGQLARRILASTKPEKDAVKAVLSEFFTLKDGVFWHQGCQATIKKLKEVSEKAKQAGSKGGIAKAKQTHGERLADGKLTHGERLADGKRTHGERLADGKLTHSERLATQNPEPRTQNPEPNTQKPETSFSLPAKAGKKKTPIPASEFFGNLDDFTIMPFYKYAVEQFHEAGRPDITSETCFEDFRDYHVSKCSEYVDWFAAFRYWVREALKRPPRGFIPPQGGNAA